MSECRCGQQTRDDAYVCDDCAADLSVALGEVPWLDEQLDITIARQKGVDYRRIGGGKGSTKERPLPANMGASGARTHLRGVLVSWVRFCAEEGVRNASPQQGLPDDTLPAISRWLMWRVDGVADHRQSHGRARGRLAGRERRGVPRCRAGRGGRLMRESSWMRVKATMCRWFGHREVRSEWEISCKRCLRLLAGPLNGAGWRKDGPR